MGTTPRTWRDRPHDRRARDPADAPKMVNMTAASPVTTRPRRSRWHGRVDLGPAAGERAPSGIAQTASSRRRFPISMRRPAGASETLAAGTIEPTEIESARPSRFARPPRGAGRPGALARSTPARPSDRDVPRTAKPNATMSRRSGERPHAQRADGVSMVLSRTREIRVRRCQLDVAEHHGFARSTVGGVATTVSRAGRTDCCWSSRAWHRGRVLAHHRDHHAEVGRASVVLRDGRRCPVRHPGDAPRQRTAHCADRSGARSPPRLREHDENSSAARQVRGVGTARGGRFAARRAGMEKRSEAAAPRDQRIVRSYRTGSALQLPFRGRCQADEHAGRCRARDSLGTAPSSPRVSGCQSDRASDEARGLSRDHFWRVQPVCRAGLKTRRSQSAKHLLPDTGAQRGGACAAALVSRGKDCSISTTAIGPLAAPRVTRPDALRGGRRRGRPRFRRKAMTSTGAARRSTSAGILAHGTQFCTRWAAPRRRFVPGCRHHRGFRDDECTVGRRRDHVRRRVLGIVSHRMQSRCRCHLIEDNGYAISVPSRSTAGLNLRLVRAFPGMHVGGRRLRLLASHAACSARGARAQRKGTALVHATSRPNRLVSDDEVLPDG